MPEQTQIERLEPEPIETYRCPKCKTRLECSLKKAQEHVDMPLLTLPLGLVYKSLRNTFYGIIQRTIIPANESTNHSSKHGVFTFSIDNPKPFCQEYEYADTFLAYTKNKAGYSLLTPEEFEEFKVKFGEEIRKHYSGELVRTTPELEELIAQEVTA